MCKMIYVVRERHDNEAEWTFGVSDDPEAAQRLMELCVREACASLLCVVVVGYPANVPNPNRTIMNFWHRKETPR